MSKYIISRVSDLFGDNPPHKKAKLEKLHRLDYRTVSTLAKAEKQHWYRQWFDRGKNHREEHGMVVCDVPRSMWTIEIDSLEDFYKENGDLIILGSDCLEFPIEVRIYDGYNE